MPAKESICVTQPFQSENCPNAHPIEICDLHSSEGIQAIVCSVVERRYLILVSTSGPSVNTSATPSRLAFIKKDFARHLYVYISLEFRQTK